jgi:hypothetical protein
MLSRWWGKKGKVCHLLCPSDMVADVTLQGPKKNLRRKLMSHLIRAVHLLLQGRRMLLLHNTSKSLTGIMPME